jgi:hypothetical protein
MQAIVTKFIGPTNHRPSRIKATADAGTCTVSWDYSLGVSDNHIGAAKALCAKLEWEVKLASGSLPGDAGYCHVIV